MDRLAAYRKINGGFKKKYIFNFGSEAGFYSEFNNMVFGMIYCLKYEYQFILYSGSSKFKTDKGWDDFFMPFCDSVDSSFHKKFNKRVHGPKIKLKHQPRWQLFKLFNKDTFLTYQLFNNFFNPVFEKEQFDFPELGLKGSLRDVSREIVKMIYRFNGYTAAKVQQFTTGLNLPGQYLSINIRRGDKDTEFGFMPVSDYISIAAKHSELKDIFILTDDYSVIDELRNAYPDINFYTLVNKDERGYVHADFVKQSSTKRADDLIKLFASLEVMRASEFAIGAYTTNPGIFLGMTMPDERFISVQRSSWYQFDRDDVGDYMVNTGGI